MAPRRVFQAAGAAGPAMCTPTSAATTSSLWVTACSLGVLTTTHQLLVGWGSGIKLVVSQVREALGIRISPIREIMERSASPSLDTTKLLLYYLYTFYMIINITKKRRIYC